MLKTTTAAEIRSAHMHDRGHTYYGTDCPTACELVGKWAARRLITPRAFLAAGRAGHDLDGIADRLGVLQSDVFAYLASLDPDEWLIMRRLLGREPV